MLSIILLVSSLRLQWLIVVTYAIQGYVAWWLKKEISPRLVTQLVFVVYLNGPLENDGILCGYDNMFSELFAPALGIILTF